jgi:pimeloyl-ACP methyl ester carboxylesterase
MMPYLRWLNVTITCISLIPSPNHAQQVGDSLRRRGDPGAAFRQAGGDSGVVITRLVADGAFARAGLQANDRITKIDGNNVPAGFPAPFRAGDTLTLTVRRSNTERQVRVTLAGAGLESIPGVRSTYTSVRTPAGYRVRIVATRPTNERERLPGVLFIPWLSCDPVERADPGSDGFLHMLRDVAQRSGSVFVRVEKVGNGDSEGPACSEGRLDQDLAAFRAAMTYLRQRPDVDSSRIVLLGGSIGGGIAPILAADQPAGIVGVVSVGGFSRTWFEHMLDIERRRLTLSATPPGTVNSAMKAFAELYHDYLIGGLSPGQIIVSKPALREYWYDAPEHQYGRHVRYFQQVQRLDPEGAWEQLARRGIPGLIVWGEYDWIMSRAEQDRAVAILNGVRSGLGTLVVLPRVDHGLMTFASMADAFADRNGRYRGQAADVINRWIASKTGLR